MSHFSKAGLSFPNLNVAPLEFYGINDPLYSTHDTSGTTEFMAYLEDYRAFYDVPLSYMFDLINETYPPLKKEISN